VSRSQAHKWRVTTQYTGTGLPVEWRRDKGLPRSWRATLEADHLPYVVELDLVASEEHGPSCRAVRMAARDDGEPISARRLRDVPVAECIQVAVGMAAIPIKRHADKIEFLMGGQPEYAGRFPEAFELAREIRPQKASTSDEHLREVARVYMAASEKPTRAVEQEFGPISHSTAARWVGQARQRGFLPPAEPRTGTQRPRQRRKATKEPKR